MRYSQTQNYVPNSRNAHQVEELIANPCNAKCWFAMRVTYQRELSVKQLLDAAHIENYIAMRRESRLVRGRKSSVMVPVVHNLVFVRETRAAVQAFKARVPHLQYMMARNGGTSEPIIVPDSQMRDFIAVSSADTGNVAYYEPGDVDLAAGTQVRVHGGSFDGLTGTFVKIKGKRNKQFVIAVQNVLAVAIDALNCDFIEKL